MLVDADSGLSLTQYRAYDPEKGRWLSRDPLGEQSAGGANLYLYANDNPVNLTDPLGLFCWPDLPLPGGIPIPGPLLNWAWNHPYYALGAAGARIGRMRGGRLGGRGRGAR